MIITGLHYDQSLGSVLFTCWIIQATLFISKSRVPEKILRVISSLSQFATSFNIYMYTDCLDRRDYNLHVHVFGNDVLEFKYPPTELLISDTNFEKAVTEFKEC